MDEMMQIYIMRDYLNNTNKKQKAQCHLSEKCYTK